MFERRLNTQWLWIILGIATLFVVVDAWPRLALPSFWDETKSYFRHLVWMYDHHGNYWSLAPTLQDRPPGVHYFYLPILWVVGLSPLTAHAISLFYFVLALIVWFWTNAKANAPAAVLALCLIVTTPIIRVYASQYNGEAQAFLLFALILWLLERRSLALVFAAGVLAGFSRETSLALVPAIAFYLGMANGTRQDFLAALGPLVGLGIVWITNAIRTGSFIHHQTIEAGDINFCIDLSTRLQYFLHKFLIDYRVLPLAIMSALAILIARPKFTPAKVFSWVIVILFLFVFTSHRRGIPRYFWTAAPFAVFLMSDVLMSLRWKWVAATVAIAVTCIFGSFGLPERGDYLANFGYQDTLDYPAVALAHEAAVRAAKGDVRAGDTIYTDWPFTYALTLDHIGYGSPTSQEVLNDVDQLKQPPSKILWSNYPQTLPDDVLKALLSRAHYREMKFDVWPEEIRLYVRDR